MQRLSWIALVCVSVALVSPAGAGKRKAKAASAPAEVETELPRTIDSETVIAMHRHLGLTDTLRSAVINGDLDAAREAGRVLARQPPITEAPHRWGPWLIQVKESASRIEDTWDLDTAARTVAEIGRTCGSCHRAEGKGPSFGPPPDAVLSNEAESGIQMHMKGHDQAMAAMWEGLISADDARYTAAATALAAAELGPDDYAPELDDTVHRLARYGARVQGIAARADTYGALLATCARCHTPESSDAP